MTNLEKLAKDEYAPGLPVKGKTHPIRRPESPEHWQYVEQLHAAKRAGTHIDLRLGDTEKDVGHSWAIPAKELPKPGKSEWAIRTETHTIPYFDFTGEIKSRYGKGQVDQKARGTAEVISANNKMIDFNRYVGQDTHRYKLVRIKDNKWRIVNVTPTRQTRPDVPKDKPKLKDVKKPLFGENYIVQPKIDGAHTIVDLSKPGRVINFYGYRESKRDADKIIDYTFKIPEAHKVVVPKDLGSTILRGELFATKDGKPIPTEQLGGILNSSVEEARRKLQEGGIEIKFVTHGVDKFRGKDVKHMDPSFKARILKQVEKRVPFLAFVGGTADPKEQEQLYKDIKQSKHPLTSEGVVVWDAKKNVGYKAKNRPDFDVYVKNVFEAKGNDGKPKGYAGGFEYSWTPEGKTTGRVGTGFNRELARDMLTNSDKYIGRAAKVESAKVMGKTRALFQPAFKEWHLEKGAQGGSMDFNNMMSDDYNDFVKSAALPKITSIEGIAEHFRSLPSQVKEAILAKLKMMFDPTARQLETVLSKAGK